MFQACSARPPGAEPRRPQPPPPPAGAVLYFQTVVVPGRLGCPQPSSYPHSAFVWCRCFRVSATLADMSSDPLEAPLTRPALVLIRDDRLRAEVRRVAAAAQRPLAESEPPVGRHTSAAAPLVILDTACARECAAVIRHRRTGVVFVVDGEPGLADWQAATGVGAERVIALPGAEVGLVEKFAEHAEIRAGNG